VSILKRISVSCDMCRTDERGSLTVLRVYADTVADARWLARKEGWRLDKLGRDVCPKHPKRKGAR